MTKELLHHFSHKTSRKYQFIFILLLLVITSITYFPSLHNDFTNYDDNRYIFANTIIQTPSWVSIENSFTSFFDGHYHPLTMLSYMLDYKLAEFNPFQYHLGNLILHLLNVLLLYLFISLLTKNKIIAFFTALLFGIQAMGVESVAWASERKNVLYVFFFLLSLISFLKYLNNKRISLYFLSLFLFMLAVLSKSQALVLAPVLVLLDYFTCRNLFSKRVIVEKIPYFIIALIVGIVAQKAQVSFWTTSTEPLAFIDKMLYSSLAYVLYIVKAFIPFNLSVLYQYPELNGVSWIWLMPILVIISLGLLIYSFKRNKTIFFGIGFFMVNIFFVLKFFDIPYGDYYMADRYSYLSSIGLFLIFASTLNYLIETKKTLFFPILIVTTIYCIGIINITRKRITIWENGITLWSSVIENYPDSFRAWNDRGNAKQKFSDFNGAIADYNEALKIDPNNAFVYGNRGNAKNQLRDKTAAIEDYNAAIKLNPKYADAYVNRGLTYMSERDYHTANLDFSKAIQLHPQYAFAYLNRARSFFKINNLSASLSDLDRCISLSNRFPESFLLRGTIRNQMGDFKGALKDLKIASELGLSTHELYFETGFAMYHLKDYNQAIQFLTVAIQQQKKREYNLYRGYCYYQIKEFNKALADLNHGINESSKDGVAYAVRAYCELNLSLLEEACIDFNRALENGVAAVQKDIDKYCNN